MPSPKLVLIACCTLALAGFALFMSGPACASGLTYTTNGQITGPSGSVSLDISGTVTVATTAGDTLTLDIPSVVIGGQSYWNGSALSNKNLVVDTVNKQTTFSATITDPALSSPIPVSFSIALTSAGKARVTLQYGCAQPITNFLSLGAIFFYTQRAPLVGSAVSINGTGFPIVEAPPSSNWTLLTTDNQVVSDCAFFSDNAYRAVTAHVVAGSSETVSDENLTNRQQVGLRVYPLNNQSVIDVDLPAQVAPPSPETYAGIDFYAAEHIHLPQYNLSRNLIQNPSFEEGLQYWNFGVWGQDLDNRIPDYYMTDATQAHSGRQCLKILGQQGARPAPVSTFAIPVNNGKQYTLSFYAKGDHAGMGLGSDVFPGGRGDTNGLFWSATLTTAWQRFSYTFNAPGPALSVQFNVGSPPYDCTAYVDDVQLEAGATMTAFTRKTLEMVSVTGNRDNIFAPGAPINARWQLSGSPGASGTLAITLRNLLGTSLGKHTAAFTLGADGTGTVPEPWLEKTGLGMYTLDATAALSTGFHVREYGRLVLASAANWRGKHHTLFAMGGTSPDSGSWDRLASHLQYFGIGSAVNFDPPPHSHLAALAKHHVTDVTAILDGGDHFGTSSATISLKNGWTGPDSDLSTLQQDAYAKASAYPEISDWKLLNEPGGNLTTDSVAMTRLVQALGAVQQGLLRAQPHAHVFSLDPYNVSPDDGTVMMDNFLSSGGGPLIDTAAIHTYRPRPEDPDLDSDLAAYLSMLGQHNFGGDVWLTEGGGWLGMNNPILGVNVHVALSNEQANGAWWEIGNLSYDEGDGERYAAAYDVRSWLVGLKYGNRVKQQVEWYFGTGVVDYDCTPQMRSVALNNLTTLLGNADYVQDIPLDMYVRSYLFNDASNRPVAVVWSHDLEHEIDTLPPSMLHLGTLASSLQMFAMDGSRVTADKTGALAVSPFPIFLRGPAGSAAKLVAALESGFVSASAGSVAGSAR